MANYPTRRPKPVKEATITQAESERFGELNYKASLWHIVTPEELAERDQLAVKAEAAHDFSAYQSRLAKWLSVHPE